MLGELVSPLLPQLDQRRCATAVDSCFSTAKVLTLSGVSRFSDVSHS